jgi:hypothetical protein
MLHDYVEPDQRWVACPNQDVVYGAAIAALDETPVVVQVPDFSGRFWVYQVVDLRTDGFAQIGAMYGTQPGFYLLAGPGWDGAVPPGIGGVFRARTGTAFVVPRVFMDDTAADREALQPLIGGIDLYPLAQFDGKMKQHDWRALPRGTGASSCPTAGAARPTTPRSGPTTSRARRSRSRTSSPTRPPRRSTSTRTSTPPASGSTALTATPSCFRRARFPPSTASGR